MMDRIKSLFGFPHEENNQQQQQRQNISPREKKEEPKKCTNENKKEENDDGDNNNNNNNIDNNDYKIEELNIEKLNVKYQHWKETGFEEMQFSVNLVDATTKALQLFDYFYSTEELQDDDVLHYSLLRYRQYLSLQFKFPDRKFVPPNDVQVIWVSHMMKPTKYRSDLTKKFGKVLDHFPIDRNEVVNEIDDTEVFWNSNIEEAYDCDFGDIDYINKYSDLEKSFPLNISQKDIKDYRKWFKSLCDQFADYQSEEFIVGAIRKYKEYLFLCVQKLVDGSSSHHLDKPSLEVELIWRVHLQCVNAYESDLNNLIGFVIPHIPQN